MVSPFRNTECMFNVIIIGAGQLGSRHLQGVLLSSNELSVYVVDPSAQSLEIAKERAATIKKGNEVSEVHFCNEIPNGKSFKVAIVATTAQYRYKVSKDLLEQNSVEHLILEKVLFQKVEEYELAKQLLDSTDTKGWVNCPRRMYPIYQQIRELVSESDSFQLDVLGSQWGMACNGIHFLDLAAYLAGESEITVSATQLEPGVVESKRDGYVEVFGGFDGKVGRGDFSLSCVKSSETQLILELKFNGTTVRIDELNGTIERAINGTYVQEKFVPLYQSQLSGIVVDQLVEQGFCQLTSYDESKSIHLPFLNMLIDHVATSTGSALDTCPIT